MMSNMNVKLSVNFSQASDLSNITSGENICTSFGKLSKFYDTSTTGLAELVDNGAKNKLKNVATSTTIGEVVYTVNADGSVTVYTNGTVAETRQLSIATTVNNIQVDVNDVISGLPPTGDFSIGYGIGTSGNTFVIDSSNPVRVIPVSGVLRYCNLNVRAGVNVPMADAVTFYPMICTKAAWDISHQFEPYALSNPVITPALIEQVDNGAKNLLPENSGNGERYWQIPVNLPIGTYAVYFSNISSTDTDASVCQFGAFASDDSTSTKAFQMQRNTNQHAVFTTTKETAYVRFYASDSYAHGAGDTVTVTNAMICTAADWAVSQKFVPYCPSMAELYQQTEKNKNDISAIFKLGEEILGTSDTHKDLNTYKTAGTYFCLNSTNAGYVDNKPIGGSGFRLVVEIVSSLTTVRQTFTKPTDASRIYVRTFSNNAWGSWYVFEGTAVP